MWVKLVEPVFWFGKVRKATILLSLGFWFYWVWGWSRGLVQGDLSSLPWNWCWRAGKVKTRGRMEIEMRWKGRKTANTFITAFLEVKKGQTWANSMCAAGGWLIIDVTLRGKFQDCSGYLDFPLSLKKWVSSGFFFSYLKFLKSTLFQRQKGIEITRRLLSYVLQTGICDF